MSKAEERALEAYPYAEMCRKKYLEGYHQAEKDLELTVDDIKAIDRLLNQCVDFSNPYEEVLKRYREMKEK